MKIKSILYAAAAVVMSASMLLCTSGCSSQTATDNTAEISVNPGDILAEMTIKVGEESGTIRFKLFPEAAPKGVENFVALAESGYYNGKTIHRVIEDFILQGGSLRGNGAGGTTATKEELPRETNERMRAYYGALGYTEDSDGINSQFFIVNNNTPFDINKIAEEIKADLEKYTDRLTPEDKAYYEEMLAKYEAVPDDVKAKYLSDGGSFSIDGNYTIFGQAIEGFDLIEKISAVEVSGGNEIDDEMGIESKPTVSIVIKKIEIARIPYIEETSETTTRRGTRTTAPTSENNIGESASVPETAASELTDAPESA